MKKTSKNFNKGFILLESLVACTLLTICILFFLRQQMVFLRQTKRLQQQAAVARVLYEEVKVQAEERVYPNSYPTRRIEDYTVSFYLTGNYRSAKIQTGNILLEIAREK